MSNSSFAGLHLRLAVLAAFACVFLTVLPVATAQIIDSGLAINHKLLQPAPICLGVSGQSADYYDVANGGLGPAGCTQNALRCYTVAGGFSTCYTGTLGSMVEDQNGTQYILSNWHVFANPPGGPAVGDSINHVAPYDTSGTAATGQTFCDNESAIPTSVSIPPPAQIPYVAPYEVAQLSDWIDPELVGNNVDAAIAEIDDGAVSSAILDIPAFRAAAQAPVVGRLVVKSGRTTGLTYGTITSVTASWPPDGSLLTNQIQITPLIPTEPFALPGDDGALVLQTCTPYPPPNIPPNIPFFCPVGLIWAFGENLGGAGNFEGLTYANPIFDVMAAFEAEDPPIILHFVPPGNCANTFPFNPTLDGIPAGPAEKSPGTTGTKSAR